MSDPVKGADTTGNRGLRASIGLCTAVIVVTALYFAGTVFAPLAFAFLIIALIGRSRGGSRRGCRSSSRSP
jgi:predicted PurR-regulated permease PerM